MLKAKTDMSTKDELRNDTKPVVGKSYWTYNIIYLPIEVEVLEIDEEKQKARIEQGWIDFSRLYNSEEECPQR